MPEQREIQAVLQQLMSQGASYSDIRLIESQDETLEVKNGFLERNTESKSQGFGIRVLFDGAWGFACSFNPSAEEFRHVADEALRIARGASRLGREKVKLAPQEPVTGTWRSPYKIDPFGIRKEDKLELLLAAGKAMAIPGVRTTRGSLNFYKEKKIFANSEGSFTTQEILISGAGIEAVVVEGEENQIRSYPQAFGGDFMQAGYEYIESLQLVENARRIAEEAVALLSAPQCPAGEKTVILGASQVALQVHESCGHPVELDRALGMELGFAGGTFLTPEKRGKFQYGSDQVNIIADATCPGGIGTFGYDDEGVPAQATTIIDHGQFVNYISSRETASKFGEKSNGTVRGESWNSVPLIRMTNINLQPGDWSLDEMIKDTQDGIFLETNRSWSIDDKRLNFQFGVEAAYEIKNGSLGRLIKNATYTGITPEFWKSCDAVANEKFWKLWGLPNCGKGEPVQTMYVGHGASPARFSKVRTGVGQW